MAVVGLSFTKIVAERGSAEKGQIRIGNTVGIEDVTESNISLGLQSQQGLKLSFSYKTMYDENFGVIELKGSLIYIDEPKQVKEVLKTWQKDKKLSPEVLRDALNAVVGRCSLQALLLSKEINLPPPVPMPKVSVETKAKK